MEGPESQIYETIWHELSAVSNRRFVQRLEEREAKNTDKSMENLISLLQYMVDVIIKDMSDLNQCFPVPDPSTVNKKPAAEDFAAFQADYERLKRRDYQKRSSSGAPETPERKRRKRNYST